MKRKSQALFTDRAPRRAGCLIYPLLVLLVFLVIAALNLIDQGHVVLKTQKVTVAALPDGLENYKILHISDLHGKWFGEAQEDLRELLRGIKYNAVCITGDVCGKNGDYSAFLGLLAIFPADTPVFFIAGDEDPEPLHTAAYGGSEVKADYVLAAEALGAVYLDYPRQVTVGKTSVWFCPEAVYGLDVASARSAYISRRAALTADDAQYLPDNAALLRMIDYRLTVLDEIEKARPLMENAGAQIALAHHPLTTETIKTLQQWSGAERGDFLRGVSLMLAGHYNAGQVRLPVLGALKAPATAGLPGGGWLPDDRLIVGLNTVQGITQYISPGLGVSNAYALPVRLFNTPAVTILTLTARLSGV